MPKSEPEQATTKRNPLLGKKAPRFSLTDRYGDEYALDEFKEKFVVLYFYPRDNTPGCTREAIEFQERLPQFAKRSAKIVGISGGSARSKEKFCSKHALDLLLLTDAEFTISKRYGAYGSKTFMGRSYEGIFRQTFLLDSARKVAHVFETVKPETHADEVLAVIDQLRKAKP